MKEKLNKVKSYAFSHKITSAIAIIIIIFLGYWGYNKITDTSGEISYVTAIVKKGAIVSSVTATGQVESKAQIDLKADTTGTITYVGVKPGDKVAKGKLLFGIDNKDALKAVRDAEVNLQSAQISLQKLQSQDSAENMNADLAKAYDDGFTDVSNAFLDLPGIMTGLDSMFFKSSSTLGSGQWYVNWYEGQVTGNNIDKVKEYKQNFIDTYNSALTAYNQIFDEYKSVARTSDYAIIKDFISKSYDSVKLISDTIKSANNYIDFVNDSLQNNNQDIPAIIATHKASLNTYTSKINTHLANLLTAKTNIKTYEDAFPNANLDLQTSQLSVKQKENALQDAKDNLLNYSVFAPFSGTIASVTATLGDTSGSTLGAIISNQKVGTLSMNEVDVAKIKLGEKAAVTFDAIDGLSVTGTVAEIDTEGTVSQGVVSYNVKISFDTDDARIKPGMSISASIVTDSKTDALYIPSSAIKTQGSKKYILMFPVPLPPPAPGAQGIPSTQTPKHVIVETGISNDTNTEIISGLNEGDQIIFRTIALSAVKTQTATSLIGGGGRIGGGLGR